MQLLAAFCSRDPQTALDLLHVELPAGALDGGQRGPDLLSMACQAVAVLAALPDPPTAAIGEATRRGSCQRQARTERALLMPSRGTESTEQIATAPLAQL